MVRALVWPEGATRRRRGGGVEYAEGIPPGLAGRSLHSSELPTPLSAEAVDVEGGKGVKQPAQADARISDEAKHSRSPSLVEIRDVKVISGSFLAVSFVRDMRAAVAVYSLEAIPADASGLTETHRSGINRPPPAPGQVPSLPPPPPAPASQQPSPPPLPPAVRVTFLHLLDFGPAVCELSIASTIPQAWILDKSASGCASSGPPPPPFLRVSFSTSTLPQTTKDVCLECGRELASRTEEVCVGGGAEGEEICRKIDDPHKARLAYRLR